MMKTFYIAVMLALPLPLLAQDEAPLVAETPTLDTTFKNPSKRIRNDKVAGVAKAQDSAYPAPKKAKPPRPAPDTKTRK